MRDMFNVLYKIQRILHRDFIVGQDLRVWHSYGPSLFSRSTLERRLRTPEVAPMTKSLRCCCFLSLLNRAKMRRDALRPGEPLTT